MKKKKRNKIVLALPSFYKLAENGEKKKEETKLC